MICNFFKSIRAARLSRQFCSGNFQVLGIESSCDDTSAAVVNNSKTILGKSHFSQLRIHVEAGGVMPNLATDLHREHLNHVAETSMKESGLDFNDLSAIAVTVKPGLILSLSAGVDFAKDLCITHRKPMIPIHHMEAHALTGRLIEDVKFPFLCFLVSGGHCILSFVQSVDKFFTLGQALDKSPGAAFDRLARRAKLSNLKKFRGLGGGKAVEAAALEGNPTFEMGFLSEKNCDFSFSGILTGAVNSIADFEKKHDSEPDAVVPEIYDICASFQWTVTKHLAHRLQVAFKYLREKNMIGDEKCVVFSGGVACNKFIGNALKFVCDAYGWRLVVPPPNLCSDNGAMVAWNGIERLRENLPVVQPEDLHSVRPIAKFPLGEDISSCVKEFARNCSFKYISNNEILENVSSLSSQDKIKEIAT